MAKASVRAKKVQPVYSVPALDKGLGILEALAVASVPQTLVQLARTLNRSSSEIFRMIDALEKRFYIVREPVSGGYQLTLKLYQLAHTHSPVEQLVQASALPMRALAAEIRESCHLCVLNSGFMTVVAQAESPEPIRLSVEVGFRMPPLTSASGRLLVAYLQPQEQKGYLDTDNTYAKAAAHERKSMLTELAAIRKAGFCMASSKQLPGIIDVSTHVGDSAISVSAALAVPFQPGHINAGNERKLIPRIQRCSGEITQALGLAIKN